MSLLKGIYNRSCALCPLHETNGATCISGRGNLANTGGVFIVGDAPSRDEAPRGFSFSDEQGRLVIEALKEAGIPVGNTGDVFATNAVKCYPNGKIKVKDMKTCADTYLMAELDRFKPSLIIVLGKNAQIAVTRNNTAIAKTHGKLQDFEREGWSSQVIAIDHPFSVLSTPAKLDPWMADIRRAKAVYNSEGSPYWDDSKLDRFDFRVITTARHFRKVARDLIDNHKGEYLAIDIEASGLDDRMFQSDFRVYSLQFGIVDLEGSGPNSLNDTAPVFIIPLQSEQWSVTERWLSMMRDMLNEFLHPRYFKTVAHNAKYDLKGLGRIGVDKVMADRCTMMLWANLHGESPLSLKEIAYQITDLGGYEKKMDEYFKEHATFDAPPELLTTYGCLDIVVTRHLMRELYHSDAMQEVTA